MKRINQTPLEKSGKEPAPGHTPEGPSADRPRPHVQMSHQVSSNNRSTSSPIVANSANLMATTTASPPTPTSNVQRDKPQISGNSGPTLEKKPVIHDFRAFGLNFHHANSTTQGIIPPNSVPLPVVAPQPSQNQARPPIRRKKEVNLFIKPKPRR